MPRLHKYRDRNACYVLTAIGGNVITYQLTPDGERKLTAAGIARGQQFQRALLLDLYRTGDAFTHGSGVDNPALAAAGQLVMDFANDPTPKRHSPPVTFAEASTTSISHSPAARRTSSPNSSAPPAASSLRPGRTPASRLRCFHGQFFRGPSR